MRKARYAETNTAGMQDGEHSNFEVGSYHFNSFLPNHTPISPTASIGR